MKRRTQLAFGIVLLSLLTNCTIQRRTFNKGWHVEWKHHYKTETTPGDDENLAEVDGRTEKVVLQAHVKQETAEKTAVVSDVKLETLPQQTDVLPIERTESTETVILDSLPKEITPSTPTEQKKEGFAITSLVLGLLGLSVLAIIFGLIHLHKQRRHPEQYTGKGMAIAGVLLGYLYLVLLSLFVLPMWFGIPLLYVVSILFFIYALIVLRGQSDKVEPLGILGLILGSLGFMLATFFTFDY
jgi:lipopolysaccharide export LptBFGC system permease protein LptF